MSIEARALRKIGLRLLPFLSLLFFIDVLDRANVGYAKLTMNQALGFGDAVFAFGVGIYFVGYLLFEVPSNLLLERVGARIWLARIMITWGIVSVSMAFMTNAISFYTFRFLLGLAEAGFLPGVILYLTYWFPTRYRARAVSRFIALSALLNALGNPISSQLLGVSGFHLAGWQWLFVLEGAPAVLLGIVALFVLTDRPSKASWLSPEQRDRMEEILAAEQAERDGIKRYSVFQALRSPLVLALSAVFFCDLLANYGLVTWLPTVIKGFGVSVEHTGWIALLPNLCSVVFMVFWGWHSDRSGERVWHIIGAMLMGSIGLITFGWLSFSPALQMVAVALAMMGHYGLMAVFWTLPTAFLNRSAAAAGVALINSLGNLAGFFGPQIVSWIKGSGNNFGLTFAVLGCAPLIGGVIVFAISHNREIQRARIPTS